MPRGVLVVLLLLCVKLVTLQLVHTSPNITFCTTLPITGPGAATVAEILGGTELALEHINNLDTKAGALLTKNVALWALDDSYNAINTDQNARLLVNQTINECYALILGGGTASTIVIQSLINGTNIPYIAPLTGAAGLRQPFQKNIFNIRGSNRDEVAAMVQWVTKEKKFFRIAMFYQDDDYGYEGFAALKEALQSVGLRVISYGVYPKGNHTANDGAIANITKENPEAVICWGTSPAIKPFLIKIRPILSNDTLYLINSLGAFPVPVPTPATAYDFRNLHVVSLFPIYEDTTHPLIINYKQDLLKYNNILAKYNALTGTNLTTPGAIESYYNMIWTADILMRIRDNLTREAFVEAVYNYPVFYSGGILSGPMTDDCSDSAVFGCCNQATHNVQLFEFSSNGTRVYTPNSDISWGTCESIRNIGVPITFGQVVNPLENGAEFVRNGISLALESTDSSETSGRSLELISYTVQSSHSAALLTNELLNEDYVFALLGYSRNAIEDILDLIKNTSDLAVIAPTSGDMRLRTQDIPSVINIRASIRDEAITLLNYLVNGTSANTNVGIYYVRDQIGIQFYQAINELKSRVTGKTELTIVASSNYSNLAVSADTSVAVLCTRENEQVVADIIIAIQKKVNHPLKVVLVGNDFPELIISEYLSRVDASDLVNFIFSSPLPLYGNYSGTDKLQNFELGKTYLTDLYNDDPDAIPTWAHYEGYVAAEFLHSVISNIHGQITRDNIATAVYATGTQIIGGLILGPFYTSPECSDPDIQAPTALCCNQGAHTSYLYSFSSVDYWTMVYQHRWEGCGASVMYELDIYNSGSDNHVSIIVGTIVGGVTFLVCLVIIALIIALIILAKRSPEYKRRKLREPNFSQFAIKRFLTERAAIDSKYVAAVSATNSRVSDKLEKKLIGKLENFILNDEFVYPVMHGLCKSGISRDDVTAAVLYIYAANSQPLRLIKKGIEKEIRRIDGSDISVLFREDGLLASVFVNYGRLAGLSYIWGILAEVLYDIGEVADGKSQQENFFSASSYEVDPYRLGQTEDQFVNLLHLKLAAQTTFGKIKNSEFPHNLGKVLAKLRKEMKKKFPELCEGVIANFVFLRFICPSITSPTTCGLMKDYPSTKTLRFLVLLSKALQNLAFGVEFEKEEYMISLNDFISSNKNGMKQWLADISDGSDNPKLRAYEKVEVTETIKMNCLKWLFSTLYENRHVLRKELGKKLDGDLYEQCENELFQMGLLRSADGTSGGTGTSDPFDDAYQSTSSSEEEDDAEEDI